MTDTAAERFIHLFSATYSLLHRRGRSQGIELTPEGRGLLLHLAWTGPLTIGELALHANRAQSVVSESVDVLEKHEMLARVRDPRDRRRTLVWLTERARQWLAEEQEPLDRDCTSRAIAAMDPAECEQLLELWQRFIAVAEARSPEHQRETRGGSAAFKPNPRKAKGK